MKAQKNASAATSQNSLMKFKRGKKNEWVTDVLFSTGISTSVTLFISLLLQY